MIKLNDNNIFVAEIKQILKDFNLPKCLIGDEILLENNHSTVLSFGAGSCKLCKNGCGKDGCNNPYLARSPLEATGCNVEKTLKKYGVDITFPATNHLLLIGLVLWQD